MNKILPKILITLATIFLWNYARISVQLRRNMQAERMENKTLY
jgi:hypothetical protein